MEVVNSAITDPPLVIYLELIMIERGAGPKTITAGLNPTPLGGERFGSSEYFQTSQFYER